MNNQDYFNKAIELAESEDGKDLPFLDLLEAIILDIDITAPYVTTTFCNGSKGLNPWAVFIPYSDFIEEKGDLSKPEWKEFAEWGKYTDGGTRMTDDVIMLGMGLPFEFIEKLEAAKSLDEIKALIKTQLGYHF